MPGETEKGTGSQNWKEWLKGQVGKVVTREQYEKTLTPGLPQKKTGGIIERAKKIGHKVNQFLMEKSLETGLPLHPLAATTEEWRNLRGLKGDAGQLVNDYRTETELEERKEASKKLADLIAKHERKKDWGPKAMSAARKALTYMQEEIQERIQRPVAGRRGETPPPAEHPVAAEPPREPPRPPEPPVPPETDENWLKNNLTRNQAINILQRIELGEFGERAMKKDKYDVPLETTMTIGGKKYDSKEQLIKDCCTRIEIEESFTTNWEDKRFLSEFRHVARSVYTWYEGPHKSTENAITREHLEETIRAHAKESPTVAEFSSWLLYLQEKDVTSVDPRFRRGIEEQGRETLANTIAEARREFTPQSTSYQLWSIYLDPEFNPDEIKTEADLQAYFYEFQARSGLELNQDAQTSLRQTFLNPQELSLKVKLKRIKTLREVGGVPYISRAAASYQLWSIYLDPEFNPDEMRTGTDLKKYLAAFKARSNLEISSETAAKLLEELDLRPEEDHREKRSALEARIRKIRTLREHMGIVYDIRRRNRSNLFPTGGIDPDLLQQLRTGTDYAGIHDAAAPGGVRVLDEKRAHTHVLNRIRGITGFMDIFTNAILENEMPNEYYYHHIGYLCMTRIIAYTILGMKIYDLNFRQASDVQSLGTQGHNLSLMNILNYAGITPSLEKTAQSGDFLSHCFPEDFYNRRRLERMGVGAIAKEKLTSCPGKDNILGSMLDAISVERYLPVTGVIGRGVEGINLINDLVEKQLLAGGQFRKIFRSIGSDASLRTIGLGSKELTSQQRALLYSLYLSPELLWNFFHQPVEFDIWEKTVDTDRGKRRIKINERTVLEKIINLEKEGNDAFQLIDDCGGTFAEMRANPILARGLTEDELIYLSGDVSLDPENLERMQAKDRAVRFQALDYNQFMRAYAAFATRMPQVAIVFTTDRGEEVVVDPKKIDQARNRVRRIRELKSNLSQADFEQRVSQAEENSARSLYGAAIVGLSPDGGLTRDQAENLAKRIARGEAVTENNHIFLQLRVPEDELLGLRHKRDKEVLTSTEWKRLVGAEVYENRRILLENIREALGNDQLRTWVINDGRGIPKVETVDELGQILSDPATRLAVRRDPELRNDNMFLTDEEREFVRRRDGGEVFRAIDQQELLRKIRFNRARVESLRREGRIIESDQIDLYEDDHVRFSDQEKRWWEMASNRDYLNAIDGFDHAMMRNEIERIEPKIKAIQRKIGRREPLTGEERWENELWTRHRDRGDVNNIYYNVREADLQDPEEKFGFEELERLLGYFSWGETRRVYSLDFPYLDFQQRHFLSYVYDYAILSKIGFFDIDNRPLDSKGLIDLGERVLAEKRKMYFRFGHEDIVGQSIFGGLDFNNKKIIGDPVSGWERGDFSYSSTGWLGKYRWDIPQTAAPHNRVMRTLEALIPTTREFLEGLGPSLRSKDIRRLEFNPWDRFKTPDMVVRAPMVKFFRIDGLPLVRLPVIFGGREEVIAENEEGLYYSLVKNQVLSDNMRICLEIVEGRSRVDPVTWRQMLWFFGVEDTATKQVGGEETVKQIFELGLGPVEIGKLIPDIKTVAGGISRSLILTPAVAGAVIGGILPIIVIGGPAAGGFVALMGGGGIGGILGGIGAAAYNISDMRRTLHDFLASRPRGELFDYWDCVIDPAEEAGKIAQNMAKGRFVPAPT